MKLHLIVLLALFFTIVSTVSTGQAQDELVADCFFYCNSCHGSETLKLIDAVRSEYEGEVTFVSWNVFSNREGLDKLYQYNFTTGDLPLLILNHTYPISLKHTSKEELMTEINAYLQGEGPLHPTNDNSDVSAISFLLLIVFTGLLDGVNPCAFAVLLFFVAVLFRIGVKSSVKKTKKQVLTVGLVYITAVFIAYLIIGLTFLRMFSIIPFTDVVAKIGAFVLIPLGVINIKDYFWPNKGLSLGIPKSLWEIIRRWMHKSAIPATFIVGLMVGLFEFPCTGGVYVSILGLLAFKETLSRGLAYLFIYNLAFVLPLLIILLFACNKRLISFSLTKWRKHKYRTMKLMSGLIMIALSTLLISTGFV